MRCSRHGHLLKPRNVEWKIDRRREDRHVAALKQALLSSRRNAPAWLVARLYVAEGGDVHVLEYIDGSHAEVHSAATHGSRVASERDVAVDFKLGRAMLSPHVHNKTPENRATLLERSYMQSKR